MAGGSLGTRVTLQHKSKGREANVDMSSMQYEDTFLLVGGCHTSQEFMKESKT